jgi:hypothetical protein
MTPEVPLSAAPDAATAPANPATGRLQYESAVPETPSRRPVWVYAVVGVYALIMLGLAVMPVVLPLLLGEGFSLTLFVVVSSLLLCEMALLFVPVRASMRRPVTRRALWVPLLASGFLVALLALGAGFAITEYRKWTDNGAGKVVLAAAGAVWLVWTAVFWTMSRRTGPEGVAARLHRWLLAGSVLELLVAVPTHVVVRRRDECCAGIGTGLGICAGVAVMLLAFGPSVVFLYYRRWQQIRPRV